MDKSKLLVFWRVLRGRLLVSFLLIMACFVFMRWILPVIHQPPAEMVLKEAGEHQFVRLRKNFNSGPSRSLKIKLNGHINGTAMMRVFSDGESDSIKFEKMIRAGEVDGVFFDQEWFEEDCRLEYEPLSATHGEIKIEYSFKTSKPRTI